MRLAFVSLETAHHRQSETNARFQTVVELLRDGGHDVHVLCARWWDGDGEAFEHEGVTYHAVAATTDARRTFACKLPIAIRTLGPDVVHAAADPPGQALAANWGATLARAPLVVEWYGAAGVGDTRKHRRVTRRADRIVVPSRLVRTRVREHGADGDRVDVLPTPLSLDRIRSVEPANGADVVYARRLDERANLESLLLALAEFRDREWDVVVLGDGPERDLYEGLASDLRIDDRVTFAGEVSRDDRLAIYRDSGVFAQTAERCVFPTELSWALAAGCAGVVEYHADSAAHELVEGHRLGFRATSQAELLESLTAAVACDHRTIDDSFDAADRRPVRNRYLDVYRRLQSTANG